MMRQQMATEKPRDQGPKKVDANQYKELAMKQTQKANEIISSQANTFASSQNAPTSGKEASSGAGNASNPVSNQKAKNTGG